MFSKHYQSELSFLREMGRAFGLAHPQLAGLLAERGGDPDVERLLEGFAFLTARIRERIDDAVPEISHGLTELLLPHYLRPLPACSVVEFTPQLKALRAAVKVPKGTELAAVPVEGTSCRFRTCFETELLPLTLSDCQLEPGPQGTSTLKLTLQTTEAGRAALAQSESLRFYLHGELGTSTLVAVWLARYLKDIQLRVAGTQGQDNVQRLPLESLTPPGTELGGQLFPTPRTAPPGHIGLLEYFTLPQRFLFFEIKGLPAAIGAMGEQVELLLRLDQAPPLPGRLARDAVRLHCTPVVNLFSGSAEPVRQELPGQQLMLRAAQVNPLHMEVYSIENVTGLAPGRARQEYAAFGAFTHLGNAATTTFYQQLRSASPLDGFSDTHLSLHSPRGAKPQEGEEVLSVELTCTNRTLPGRLGVGDIKVATSTSPTLAQFRNVAPITQPVPPPLGEELHWQLLGHLALNLRTLADADALRSVLSLYNFQARADQNAARATTLKIDAIRGMELTPARRFLDRVPVRGLATRLTVDETRFASVGDAFLFGCVLERLLGSAITLNSFHELSMTLEPSRTLYRWAPRNGERQLL